MSYRKELPFGLDIGDHSIKALQFRMHRKNIQLVGFSVIEIPSGILLNGEVLKMKELAYSIKAALKKAHIVGRKVVTGLPEAHTFVKLLQVEAQGSLPLQTRVETELQKHLPYELNEVWWDFAPLTANDTALNILAGAAPRPLVDSYTTLLTQAGLIPTILCLEPLAIVRATLPEQMPAICAMIVDLGATKSTLIIATSQAILATADGHSAGDDLTKNLAEKLHTEIHAAEEMKQKYGLTEGPPEYRTAVEEYVSTLASRIHEIISITLNHDQRYPAVSAILLAGGGALLKGLPEQLTNTLKIPARLANPWVNAGETVGSAIGGALSLRFATVSGFALIALKTNHIL